MIPVKVTQREELTPDIIRVQVQKPLAFLFTPGQAASISTAADQLTRAFTITSPPYSTQLEFIIKHSTYDKSPTNAIIRPGTTTLSLGNVYGKFRYSSEGVFIAGVPASLRLSRLLAHILLLEKIPMYFSGQISMQVICS